jgi:putative RNA 2'-phosphotransferase
MHPVSASRSHTNTSRLLSLVLRHDPDKIGIELDSAGWVSVETLLAALARHGRPITRSGLDEVVATNDKKRFAFSDDGKRIRASQGHSVEVELGLEPVVPPEELYHGTATRFLETIRAEGLRPMSRQHVHLSGDVITATKVGVRHGKPVILIVAAGAMHRSGVKFYCSANGVWLTDAVEPQYLRFPES